MIFEDINDYINLNIRVSNDYKKNLESLNAIIDFFNKKNKVLSPDLIIELVKNNNIIKELLKKIILNNINDIKNNNFNSDLMLIIEVYCSLNGINIESNDNVQFDEKNLVISDNLKIYLNEINKISLLTKQEEELLFMKLKDGNKSIKNELVERNLKLVVSIAKKYVRPGIGLLDLIQEGNMGLMKAVDMFDITKGYKFSTYATWWIRQYVLKAMHETRRNIKLPLHTSEQVEKLKKITNELSLEYGREPTVNELSKRTGFSIEKIEELKKNYNDTASIDTYIDEEETTALSEMLPSDEETIDEAVINNIMDYEFRQILENSTLTKRELEVIKLRYGFYDNEKKTLEFVGKIFNLSRQRVAQIEKDALKKLRKSKKILSYAEVPKKTNNSSNSNKHVIKQEKVFIGFNSIYEFFNSYTKEEVDLMISKLDYEERKLLKLRWGNNFDEPSNLKMSKEYQEFYYKVLLPRMKKLLSKIHDKKVNYVDGDSKENGKTLKCRKK